ncbi:LCP family protein [Dehalobacterium formicoaceticum]|uniref:LCP family protein n=1 Tax=Dehalobacterium formicoaceticum TaxID=51515 RepID=A0ABT1Y7R3_9FIRM|nr:LCP family protein [Dehalobacterium formicoaceticum]MCR6545934.1 LCP family protein [Dehalobacterium formicoaceticum]
MSSKFRNLMTVLLVLFLVGSAGAIYLISTEGNLEHSQMEPGQEDWIRGKDRINILLLGTDEEFMNKSRTDTIILASLDMQQHQISLLSIPRDTRVKIPVYGDNRINTANVFGGVELVKESISQLIKVPIDYYVLTNFNGFVDIVNTLGGVELDVEQNMKYRVYDGMIDLEKGVQRLDGEKALQYVRYRHDKLGDITRTQRQQKFLSALAAEMMQSKNIVKLPVLIPQMNEAIETDLTIAQMIGLGKDFSEFASGSIVSQTLPGNFMDINGGSYWYVDESKAQQVVLEVFAGNSGSVIDTTSPVRIAEKDNSAEQNTAKVHPVEKQSNTKKAEDKKEAGNKKVMDRIKENNKKEEEKKTVPVNQEVVIEINEEEKLPEKIPPKGKIEVLPPVPVEENKKSEILGEEVAPEAEILDTGINDQKAADPSLEVTPEM